MIDLKLILNVLNVSLLDSHENVDLIKNYLLVFGWSTDFNYSVICKQNVDKKSESHLLDSSVDTKKGKHIQRKISNHILIATWRQYEYEIQTNFISFQTLPKKYI